ncbi:hypothetical protein GCM10027578_09800 [Spirosoma luteolum]
MTRSYTLPDYSFMINHEESTELLDQTMSLFRSTDPELPQLPDSTVIDQWIAVLREGSNTSDIAQSLGTLKQTIESEKADHGALETLLNKLADQVTQLSTSVGSEGDMVTRLQGLAAALHTLAGKLSNTPT